MVEVREYSRDILDRAGKIRMLILDVDGVLTDGRIVYGDRGDELKNFDVSDGLGITLLKRAGLRCVILTARASKVVKRRARGLKVDKVYHNFHYKIRAYRMICRAFRLRDEEVCFIGDDLIDIPVLKRAGLAVSPCNAMEDVKTFAHLITLKKGGRGAVREVCDLILKAQGRWDEVTARYFND